MQPISQAWREFGGRMIGFKRIRGYLSGSGLNPDRIETFHETQSRRFIRANQLTIIIAILACFSELYLSTSSGAVIHLLVAVPMFAWYIACHILVRRGHNVERLAQIWMAIGCLGLWGDIAISGGVTGHAALMLLLVPVGSALLLGFRDICIVAVSNIFAVIGLVLIDIFGTAGSDPNVTRIVTTASLLIVNIFCNSITVLLLVSHNNRIRQALSHSLARTLHVSEHDQLTGLANRKWINDRLAGLDAGNDRVELYLIDLDGFKQVNDLYGHAIGDALLQAVAKRLNEACSARDAVARLGGDEFLVLSSLEDKSQNADLASALVEALKAPFYLGELEVLISGSVGTACFPKDAATGEQLMVRADVALYAAKSAGRNQHISFQPELEAELRARNVVLKRLRGAIREQAIYLEYQPQYSMRTGELVGFEALARWVDKKLGRVGPDIFIPVAEESGLINDLGEQLLRRVCLEGKHWVNLANPASDLKVSVNLSPLQIGRPDFVAMVENILEETGFPAHRLELEITERVFINDPASAGEKLRALVDIGVGIALDDFGKGYSSMSHLQALSLTRLKIDRGFIADIETQKGAAFVRAIIQLAKALELEVIAEGVETRSQLEALKRMDCCVAQGFLFSPGVTPDQMLSVALNELKSAQTDFDTAGGLKAS